MLCKGILGKAISIHALREEGDNSPCVAWEQGRSISIHALREEGDLRSEGFQLDIVISIHALREEGDTLMPQSR